MSAALIVAEPETETRGFLERQLSDDGFDVLGASHPGEVFDLAERVRPDLVLVAELELCTRLRDGVPGRSWDRDVPVILLGPRGGERRRPRPRARARRRRLRRPAVRVRGAARAHPGGAAAGGAEAGRRARGGGDPHRPADPLCAGRRPPPAAPGEGVRAPREAGRAADARVYEKDELLREVWGFRSIGRTRTLDSHASRVRRRIAPLTKTPYVINVWGVGYRLMLPD